MAFREVAGVSENFHVCRLLSSLSFAPACSYPAVETQYRLVSGCLEGNKGAFDEFIRERLPEAHQVSYQDNKQEDNRFQHPTNVESWTTFTQQAKARLQGRDVKVLPKLQEQCTCGASCSEDVQSTALCEVKYTASIILSFC